MQQTEKKSAATNSMHAVPSTSIKALVVLASRLGLSISLDEVLRRFSPEPGEPATKTLVALAREIGLEAKSLRVTFAELPRLKKTLPAILRAKDGGALLLEDARSDPMLGSVAIIRDPSAPDGEVVAIEELRLAEVWEGEVVLVKRGRASEEDQRPFGLGWLVNAIFREKALLRSILAAAFVNTIFVVSPPFILMLTIDRVMVNHTYQTLMVLTGVVLFTIVFEMALMYLRNVLTQSVQTRIDGRLTLHMLEKLLNLPMDYFETNPTGRIITKLQQVWHIRAFLTGQLFGTFLDAVPLFGILPVLFLLEWHLALFVVALSILTFLTIWFFLGPIFRLHRLYIVAEQGKYAHLVETIYGIRTIKSMSLEARRRKEWDHHTAECVEKYHAVGMMTNYPKTLTIPFERTIYLGSLLLGAYMILAGADTNVTSASAQGPGNITLPAGTVLPNGVTLPGIWSILPSTTLLPGALVAFAMLAGRLSQPLLQLARLQHDLGEVNGAIHQIASVLNAPPEIMRENGLRLPIKGEVEFKDVRFRYNPDAPYALDGVSFKVPKGTVLGIMGRSGSGKTTITRLLQCLHSGYEGTIKIDGMDLREIDLSHLRTHIGVVPQENFLFSGTIRDNIAMARPNATFLEVVRAAQLSGAEEFIERLPRGYDTVLEEGAVNLSGGQRQRMAIGRALLIDPPILILDEATSALDAESEAIVNANLKRIAKGRTVLSISHRLSMLVEADAILVLEGGKVYDIGKHEELVQRCDIYKQMWYQQNRHLDPRASMERLLVAPEAVK